MFSDSLTSYFHKDTASARAYITNASSTATVFLRSVVEICDSVTYCEHTFENNGGMAMIEKSSESLRVFVMAAFAMLMSNFEVFQKKQFADLVDSNDFMNGFDDIELAKRLEKEGCSITLYRILAARGEPREPGQIVADSLTSWHNPSRVNQYFKIVFPTINIYSNSVAAELELMWQLRHSIVHTGGTITREDAAKVSSLRRFSDQKLVLEGSFILEVGRRLHVIVKQVSAILECELRKRFIRQEGESDAEVDEIIKEIVGCTSTRPSWFEIKTS